ncbi:MAG: ABC transporter substrate-binding protein [Deltaproteobacteria bacterium]|nr:ABC transporter substrate-binding protein [Deltaproteobacteria bacterium]
MEQTFAEKRGVRGGSGRSWLCTILLVAGCLASTAAAEDGPRHEIERALRLGVSILGDSKLREEAKLERLRAAVLPLFDFPEMARRSLGAHWRRRTPEQRKEFTRLFTRLLERTYASRISAYNGQRMHFLGEEIDGRYAQVNTRIVDRAGRKFDVNYRVHRVSAPAGWRIYDIVIENISLVNNYRAQFNRVINRSSYESLVAKLRG